jgi:hypothetical protein
MSRKPRAGQIETITTNFNHILSGADTDVQIALETIDNYIFPESRGGTGQLSYSVGSLLHADGYDSLTQLPIGADGAVLMSDGYVPYWSAGSGGNSDYILVGKIDILTPDATVYLLPNYSESNSEDFIAYIIDGYGFLDSLMVHANNPCGNGQDMIITVRVDGADTVLTATLADNNTDVSNILSQVTVNPGSLITVKAVTSVGCSVGDLMVSIKYTQQNFASTLADYIMAGKVGIVTPNATRYLLPNYAQSTDEVFPVYIIPATGTISNLDAYCSTSPGFGDDIVLTVRINGVDSLLTVTLADTDQMVEDSVNVVAVSAGDIITVKSVTSATCAVADLFLIMRYNT